jgi:phosphoglycolate phosphatase
MDPPGRLQTLVFDLDGTLTDPYAGMSRSYLHALKTIGRPPLFESELRSLIGPPMQVVFATLCGGDVELVPAAITAYRERYSRIGLFENVVYPGIREALQVLGRSYELFVCTAKPLTFAKRILERFGLADYFAGIYGSELDGTRADKRELLRWLFERERIVPRGAALIGDRKYDITAALVNGVTPVGVLWGYGTEDELREAGAGTFLTTPSELATHFA